MKISSTTRSEVKPEITSLINTRSFSPNIGDPKAIHDLSKLIREEEAVNKLIHWEKVASEPTTYYVIGIIVC